MLDGATEIADRDKTEDNRALIRSFIETTLINGQIDLLADFVDPEGYIEHNPDMSDGLEALRKSLTANESNRHYETLHRVLAEGNFALSVTEGHRDGKHVSFYDLFRIHNGLIVEHWDTVDEIPPRSQWVNDNGKF